MIKISGSTGIDMNGKTVDELKNILESRGAE